MFIKKVNMVSFAFMLTFHVDFAFIIVIADY